MMFITMIMMMVMWLLAVILECCLEPVDEGLDDLLQRRCVVNLLLRDAGQVLAELGQARVAGRAHVGVELAHHALCVHVDGNDGELDDLGHVVRVVGRLVLLARRLEVDNKQDVHRKVGGIVGIVIIAIIIRIVVVDIVTIAARIGSGVASVSVVVVRMVVMVIMNTAVAATCCGSIGDYCGRRINMI